MKTKMTVSRAVFVLAVIGATGGRLWAQFDASTSSRDQSQLNKRLPPQMSLPPLIKVKITLEDGAPLAIPPHVIMADREVCRVADIFRDGTVRFRVQGQNLNGYLRQLQCKVWKISVPGYQDVSGFVHDGSVIVMRRLGPHEGASVSITTLSAPLAAQKAYGKGEGLMARRKWSEAERQFEEAVGIYASYANAWSELGHTFAEQGRWKEAQQALEKAIAADPHYVKPIIQSAALAGQQHRWEEEHQEAQRALDLHPVNEPSVYYYKAEAEYHLGYLDEAQKLCHAALTEDWWGEVPQVQLLLGMILADQGQRAEAREAFRAYEKLVRHGPLVEEARKRRVDLTP